MALVTMTKLTLIGLNSEREKVLEALARTQNVQISNTLQLEQADKVVNTQKKTGLTLKMAEVEQCMLFVQQCLSQKQQQLKKLGQKQKLTANLSKPCVADYSSFADANKNEFKLYNRVIDRTKAIKTRLSEIDIEIQKQHQSIDLVEYYLPFEMQFSHIKDTQSASLILGTMDTLSPKRLLQLTEMFDMSDITVVGQCKGKTTIFAVAHYQQKDKLIAELSQSGFVKCPFDCPLTAQELLDNCNNCIQQLQTERQSLLDTACSFKDSIEQLKVLYDYYSIAYQLTDTDTALLQTESTFILEGWLPQQQQDAVRKAIEDNSKASFIQFDQPKQEENPPTAYNNSKLVQPFETIVDMYSPANYREKDPSTVVALFYWMFLGIIMADVGYGLVLLLGGYLGLKYLKPRGDGKKLMTIFTYGGVSCIFWGIMFGGYFSIEASWIPKPVLFNPQVDSLAAIGLCIGLGVIHIVTGLALKAADSLRQGNWADALFDSGSWILFFVGGGIAAVGMLLTNTLLSNIGIYTVIGSMVIVMLTAGRKNKNIVAKAMAGVGGAYGVINYVNDALSYLRLFGLMLAGGVIGAVFNQIAGLLMSSLFTIPLGVVVVLIGHGLNLGLSFISVYVHDSRLQHIEFFSKFYSGGGTKFKPFGNDRKYTQM